MAIQSKADKANEISGLMITGVAGGAIVPPLMGLVTVKMGSQMGGVFVITLCIVYLLWVSFMKPIKVKV